MSEVEELKIKFLRIEVILWLLIVLSAVSYTFADYVNVEWSSLITSISGILFLTLLLTKIIKSVKLKNTVRIVIYTILFIILLTLYFVPIFLWSR